MMLRNWCLGIFLAISCNWVMAQSPPTELPLPTGAEKPANHIVIRPQKPGTNTSPSNPASPGKVNYGTDPDRPGYLVIRPNSPTGTGTGTGNELPAPSMTTTPGGIPHLVIIRPKDPPSQELPEPQTSAQPPIKVPTVTGNPAQPKPDEPKDGKVLFESWDAAFCRGYKIGYFHVVVREFEKDQKKYIYAVKEMNLTVARFGQAVEQFSEDTTIESSQGDVLVTQMRQGIGKNQTQAITGRVTEKGLEVEVNGPVNATETIPWSKNVIGISKEAMMFQEKKPKPGDTIEYLWYEARINRVVQFNAKALDVVEQVVVTGQKPRKLLPVVSEMKPIGDFKLPPVTAFLDPTTFEIVKMESDMPILGGRMSVIRTTREAATRAPARRLDLAEVQSIKLNQEVRDIHRQKSVTYRIQLTGDLPIEKSFSTDDRQTMNNLKVKTKTFDLEVQALRAPTRERVSPNKLDDEYLSQSYFLDWNDERVKKYAANAISKLPALATPWQKAQAVERWVRDNMQAAEFSQAMSTCANVAKNLSGDCTEYAVLATGMCRALGIPAKTAIGVVYAPAQGGLPTLAWHMWYEVYVDGQWLALDGTLGMGSVGPGHIKITDASWDGEKSFAPLLPVLNVLGSSPKVEIIKAER